MLARRVDAHAAEDAVHAQYGLVASVQRRGPAVRIRIGEREHAGGACLVREVHLVRRDADRDETSRRGARWKRGVAPARRLLDVRDALEILRPVHAQERLVRTGHDVDDRREKRARRGPRILPDAHADRAIL